MIKIGVLVGVNPDNVYLNQLSGDLPFRISGICTMPQQNVRIPDVLSGYPVVKDSVHLIRDSDALILLQKEFPDMENVISAVRQFKHIFFSNASLIPEKEFHTLLKLSQEANTLIRTGNPAMYNPAYSEAVHEVNNPLYLEFLRPDDGCLKTISHLKTCLMSDIEIALTLTKSQARKTQAHVITQEDGIFQLVYARVEFDNGACVSMNYTSLTPEINRKLRIFQPNCSLFINFTNFTSQKVSLNHAKQMYGPETPEPEIEYIDHGKHNNHNTLEENEIIAFAKDISTNKDRIPFFEDSYNAHVVAENIISKIQA